MAYSYIAPIPTDQARIGAHLVPLVLAGFGVGSFIGTILGGPFGHKHPWWITIVTPALTAVVLVAISAATDRPWLMTWLVVILGLFGLSANGVLIHHAVRFSSNAATLGAALAISAFNAGTAFGAELAGATLSTSLGLRGPLLSGLSLSRSRSSPPSPWPPFSGSGLTEFLEQPMGQGPCAQWRSGCSYGPTPEVPNPCKRRTPAAPQLVRWRGRSAEGKPSSAV